MKMRTDNARTLEGLMNLAGVCAEEVKHRIIPYYQAFEKVKDDFPACGYIDVRDVSCRFDLRDNYSKEEYVKLNVSGTIDITGECSHIRPDGFFHLQNPTTIKFKDEELWISLYNVGKVVKYLADKNIPMKEALNGPVKQTVWQYFKKLVA